MNRIVPLPTRTSRSRDDTPRFVARLASLTGIRVRSTNAASLPRELLGQAVPDPGVLVRTYGGELEPRTHNALCQCDPGLPGESWTLGRLLAIRGFGVFSLLDLLEVLARHGALGNAPEQAPSPRPTS